MLLFKWLTALDQMRVECDRGLRNTNDVEGIVQIKLNTVSSKSMTTVDFNTHRSSRNELSSWAETAQRPHV